MSDYEYEYDRDDDNVSTSSYYNYSNYGDHLDDIMDEEFDDLFDGTPITLSIVPPRMTRVRLDNFIAIHGNFDPE